MRRLNLAWIPAVFLATLGCSAMDNSQATGSTSQTPAITNPGSTTASTVNTNTSTSVGLSPVAGNAGSRATFGVASSGGMASMGGATSMVPASGGSFAVVAPGGAAGVSATGGMASTGGTPGDKFQPVGTNPFVMVAHDPFSTFAADVDTASYDIFRRDAQLGTLPTPSSVRLEEYVNYFSYNYPVPEAESPHPFRISLAAANQVFDRPTVLLRVGVQAAPPPTFIQKPVNMVFLLDVSGSMGDPNKLPLVQKMMVAALDRLVASDTVALVTYSDTAKVLLPPTFVGNRATLEKAINSLSANGSTAGADGIGLAYKQAAAGYLQGGINHIVLCTDGDFNVGPSSTSELLKLIREKRDTGVTLTVLGFGSGNLNDAMMEQVADAGNGIYSVIIDEASAKKYVAEKLLSTVLHVAKDMKLQVEFNPDQVLAYRLLGYEDRDIADQNFRNDAIDAGEVGAGHRVTALYELVLTGGTLPLSAKAPVPDDGLASTLPREVAPGDLVLVKVRYKAISAAATDPALETSASLSSGLLSERLSAADQDMQWAVAVAALAELLKGSPYADRAFLTTIRSIASAQAGRDADRKEFATLLEKVVPRL